MSSYYVVGTILQGKEKIETGIDNGMYVPGVDSGTVKIIAAQNYSRIMCVS